MEAETDNCGPFPPTPITDEWFSYSARGESSTLYEKTPHSGSYYSLSMSYWPNGALNTLSGIGLPTLTYGVDGEGRATVVSASSGQSPVISPGTTYNTSGRVTSVALGSGDTVTNTFDANTGRQLSYAEAINGSTISGTLTWNPNGTLSRLVIVDPFNSTDAQTCNYAHDDLARIASASCGTPWSQTFTYDAFGNLTKNGSITWTPGYNLSTNRYTLGGTTYDADGNLLTDTFHTYTWNADNRPLTVDAVALTYDAFGRLVEKNNSGVFSEYVYDAGSKNIATMTGATLTKGLVPLPGGIQATYDPTNSGYRVPDWLGTVRMASNATRTYSSSRAFAPFGERYSSGGSSPSNYTFTGMINSTVTDEYDFLARSMQTSQGRWISPDPAGLAAASLSDPQSWNRYAYVSNSPLSFVDPFGLVTACPPNSGPGNANKDGTTSCGSGGDPGPSPTDPDPGPTNVPRPEQPPTKEPGGGGGPPKLRRRKLSRDNCDSNSLMDKAIREGSLLRLRQTYMDWLVEGGLKYGALKGLEKLAASAGADLTNFALFEDATFGVGSLVILGATLMDAYCFMPDDNAPRDPAPPFVP
jgi:RHS repeat-associated protein